MKIFSIFLLMVIFCTCVRASDLEKEDRMRAQVADYVMDGEVVFLKSGLRDFLSIYMASEAQEVKGAVIILHGRGLNPNWPELVYPLRTGLTEYAWDTLSIQLPVLDNDASFYDYMDILHEAHPRINAAVEFLKQKNIKNIILLAHSCSVHTAVYWLYENPQGGVNGFIGIGMGSTDTGQPMRKPFPLDKIYIPVLDIYGENDFPSVRNNAARRLNHTQQAGNTKSLQQVIPGSDHYHSENNAILLREIVDWLESL
ncbi:hypothetical protein MNBD_GAMMA09-2714 [hydrothermal vent metagenome]|uniref:DUF3530 family protein n=1 Tax=hydrothermal vent metagenome TaxID=652676 RepID=A0A3B0XHA9_9ZZZZ